MTKFIVSSLAVAALHIALAILFTGPSLASAACCNTRNVPPPDLKSADDFSLPQCNDGTDGTPCCGHGKCNIFCCACSGGCREATKSAAKVAVVKGVHHHQAHPAHPAKRHHRQIDSSSSLHFMDTDADGLLSLKEVQHHWGNSNSSRTHSHSHRSARAVRLEFERYDLNDDGFISAQELEL